MLKIRIWLYNCTHIVPKCYKCTRVKNIPDRANNWSCYKCDYVRNKEYF